MSFKDVMRGYEFGQKVVQDYQDAKLEKAAGDAYKNTGQQSATNSDFNKVEMEGLYQGPGSDGQMTNAEAASYGLMQPSATKTHYTLGGKTQDAAFTDSQIEAARARASADVYANAGRIKEASGLRRDAAQMGLTELQSQAAQREYDQNTAMVARLAAMPKIGAMYNPSTGDRNVDLAARQATLEAEGLSPEEAKAKATDGLRKITLADQHSYVASVYLDRGDWQHYQDAIAKAATERSNQVRRDINRATTIEGINEAYGHIDDGKSVRAVPQVDATGKPTGRFQVETFDQATGKGAGLFQAGKLYDGLDQFKADANVMANDNPDAFVAHEQAMAKRAVEQEKLRQEQLKIAETGRSNKAHEDILARNADTASLSARNSGAASAAQVGLHNAQLLEMERATAAKKVLDDNIDKYMKLDAAGQASPQGKALERAISVAERKTTADRSGEVTVSESRDPIGNGFSRTARDRSGRGTTTFYDRNYKVIRTEQFDINGPVTDSNAPKAMTEADYKALPSGTQYHHPNDPPGVMRTKP